MSDLFHIDVPQAFIQAVFATMAEAHWHSFQVLTKRADRLALLAPSLVWPSNVWMGVSVEDQKHVARIQHLNTVPAAVRFLSIEPLLGPIRSLDLHCIDWVIVGGESGPNHRPADLAWIQDIRDQCLEARVPFFRSP
jgi:protein gp37